MRRLTLPERADWRDTANRMGFTFHTAEGTPYWDESAAFAFSLREIEEEIELRPPSWKRCASPSWPKR